MYLLAECGSLQLRVCIIFLDALCFFGWFESGCLPYHGSVVLHGWIIHPDSLTDNGCLVFTGSLTSNGCLNGLVHSPLMVAFI